MCWYFICQAKTVSKGTVNRARRQVGIRTDRKTISKSGPHSIPKGNVIEDVPMNNQIMKQVKKVKQKKLKSIVHALLGKILPNFKTVVWEQQRLCYECMNAWGSSVSLLSAYLQTYHLIYIYAKKNGSSWLFWEKHAFRLMTKYVLMVEIKLA